MRGVASAKSGCCNTLLLRSNGGLAQGMQKHLLGQYFRDDSHDGEEGTMVYKQPGHGGGDPEVYLYYKGGNWPDMWFLNSNLGQVQGFAWIDAGKEYCPESLTHQWQWYNGTSGKMELDETAEMVCIPDPPATTSHKPFNPDTDCCKRLTFTSTGAIPDSIQSHVLGTYEYVDEGQVNTLVYRKKNHESWLTDDYLYYMPDLSLWYVGNQVGVNMGFVMNTDDAKCPENLTKTWKWTDGGSWILDDTAEMTCS